MHVIYGLPSQLHSLTVRDGIRCLKRFQQALSVVYFEALIDTGWPFLACLVVSISGHLYIIYLLTSNGLSHSSLALSRPPLRSAHPSHTLFML